MSTDETKTALPQDPRPRIPVAGVINPPKSEMSASLFLAKHKQDRIFDDAPVMIRNTEIMFRFYILSQSQNELTYNTAYQKTIRDQAKILGIKNHEVPLDQIFDQKLNLYNAIENILLSAHDPDLDKPIFSTTKEIMDFLTPEEINLIYSQYVASCGLFTPMIDYMSAEDYHNWAEWFKTAKEMEKTFFFARLEKTNSLPGLVKFLVDHYQEQQQGNS